MIPWLDTEDPFPPVCQALEEPNGLLAAGGSLSPERLINAYCHGIFPWFSEGQPILWWSPHPRTVLDPKIIRLSHSLRKRLRSIQRTGRWNITADAAFGQVIRACATIHRQGQAGTWIVPEMVAAYERLHALGIAHSVEVWEVAADTPEATLIGGLYGIALGRQFFGESMFHRQPDASKVALAELCRFLERAQFGPIDCQMQTPHLLSLGAQIISREQFIAGAVERISCPTVDWRQFPAAELW